MESEIFTSASEEQTHQIGMYIASQLRRGDIVAITGELGAGKTEFVRGVCRYFEVEDIVTSPTFSIINVYDGHTSDGEDIRIVHIDLYRLTSKEELHAIGLEEWLALPDAIKLIEWPEKANGLIKQRHYHINIRTVPTDDNQRIIQVSTVSVLTNSQA